MSRNQANALLLFAALLWGGGNVAQSAVAENIGPFLAVGLRCLIAALVLLPFVLSQPVSKLAHDPTHRKLGSGAILAFVAAVTCQQFGFTHTSVTNVGFIINTTTVITPVFAWFMMSQRPAMAVWPAAVMSLVGTVLMTGGAPLGYNMGDVFCLASAIFYSIWMVLLGAYVIRCGNVMRFTIVQFLVTSVICLALSSGFETIRPAAVFAVAPELLALGAFSTGLAYLLQSIAQQRTSASEAAIITSGEALFGATGAFLLLGETLTFQAAVGAVLMCFAILLVQVPDDFLNQVDRPRQRPRAPGKPRHVSLAKQISERVSSPAPIQYRHDGGQLAGIVHPVLARQDASGSVRLPWTH